MAQYVLHQDLQRLQRGHTQGFEAIGGLTIEILYVRMKAAVTGDDQGHVVYNPTLLGLAPHYRFRLRACRPYPAKTTDEVEQSFRVIRCYPRIILE